MADSICGADGPVRTKIIKVLDSVRRQAGVGGARGTHRIYLGMAAGVGKTYAALEELHRAKDRGDDAVIAFVETYGRPKTVEVAQSLETVPRKRLAYKGVEVEEMDADAVIQRQPAIALVDELAHTNGTWRAWPTSSKVLRAFRFASGYRIT